MNKLKKLAIVYADFDMQDAIREEISLAENQLKRIDKLTFIDDLNDDERAFAVKYAPDVFLTRDAAKRYLNDSLEQLRAAEANINELNSQLDNFNKRLTTLT